MSTLTRRGFVSLAATAAAGCASAHDRAAADATEALREHIPLPEAIDRDAFPCGVQVGDASPDGASVSFRFAEDAPRLLLVRPEDDSYDVVDDMDAIPRGDGSFGIDLSGLEPDTEYAVAAYAPDGIRRSRSARFRTALAPGGSRPIRFGVTSCLGTAKPNFPSLRHAFAERLDFGILLGDTIYADDGPEDERYRFHDKYTHALGTDGLGDWTCSTSLIATWDDHELDNNWSPTDPDHAALLPEALSAFRHALPQRQGPTGAIWRTVRWGDAVDVFMLDVRSERLDGHYISPAQMQWLQEGLITSRARFKLIATPVPIFDFAKTIIGPFRRGDRWQGHRAQRSEIVSYIRDNGIEGVVWLSGDVHFGMLGTIDRPGDPGDDQWEVICGPGGSRINPGSKLLERTERKPIVLSKHSYTLFEADPTTGRLSLWFVGDDGETLDGAVLEL